MKANLLKIDGLYDIQPPAAAALSNAEWFMIFFVSALLSGLVLYLLLRKIYSRKNRIKREILRLQKFSSINNTNPHDTIYLLSDFLRRGLGLTCLTKQTRLPDKIASQQVRWSDFTSKLDQLRYKKNNATAKELDHLFSESLFWLRYWP